MPSELMDVISPRTFGAASACAIMLPTCSFGLCCHAPHLQFRPVPVSLQSLLKVTELRPVRAVDERMCFIRSLGDTLDVVQEPEWLRLDSSSPEADMGWMVDSFGCMWQRSVMIRGDT